MYQEHLMTNKVELETELSNLAARRQQIQKMHPRHQNFHMNQAEVEGIFLNSSLDLVRKEAQKALEDFEQEQELAKAYSEGGSGVYQNQPAHLIASNYEFTTLPQSQQQQQQLEGEDRFRGNSIGSETESLQQSTSCYQPTNDERQRKESLGSEKEGFRNRSQSLGSYYSIEDSQATQSCDGSVPLSPDSQNQGQRGGKRSNKHKKKQEFPKASVYLDDEGSTHFYQCEDGKLCFLSSFNMSCLLSDLSPKVPDRGATAPGKNLNYWQRRTLLPLPDTVEGEIIEIENIHLTPEMRKRMPFLAHLPLYTDITFVEIDINNLLSNETKQKFKADFEKRRKRRQSKVKAEKREDKLARKKEEERINELKARMHQIDPDDDFFQFSSPPEETLDLTSEAFGPAVSGRVLPTPALAAAAPVFSFSNVTQSGGVFPALVATNTEENFPTLGSPAASASEKTAAIPTPASTWGGNHSTAPADISRVDGSSATETTKNQPQPGPKRKSKGKKISLFSTGGQRGGMY